jgi:hypothetical protein
MTTDAQIVLGDAMIWLGIVLLAIILRLKRGKAGPSPLAKFAEARRLEKEAAREAVTAKAAAQTRANDAQARIWLRRLGFVARLIVYAALFGLVYHNAPNDVSNTPLARLILHDIFGWVFAVVAFSFLIWALFNPSEDDVIKNAWGWIGVVIIWGGIIALALRGSFS